MKNKVSNDRRCDEPRESQDVGEGIDVFVGSKLFEGI
jgi:hypothetical protein